MPNEVSSRSDEGGIELSVVVPVYQEESTIPGFLARIEPVLESIAPLYEIIFCMDPGVDKTETVIRGHMVRNPRIHLLVLTRRWGQPAATMAGIEYCTGRACVVIDVDLQDPPELMRDLHGKWKDGYDVVLAQRRSRKGETIPKRIVSYVGYWLINRVSEVPIPRNTGDFRLMDRKVVEQLRSLKETHGFLRGLVGYVGFRQALVSYDRDERQGGVSKYSQITGSLRIGLNGVVAFSCKPLSLATMFGFAVAGISVLMTVLYIGRMLILGTGMLTGLAPVMLLVTFLGGVQLITVGIMGEYVGRIYEEVRMRPKFIVDRAVGFGDHADKPGSAHGRSAGLN